MKLIEKGTITDVPGFKAAGIPIGIKASGKPDLALIYSEVPAISAVTLTQNRFRAAPVDVCYEYFQHDFQHALIINSGNANACTGTKGLENAYKMTELVANQLNIPKESVFVASTGVIGKQLDMSMIEKGIIAIIPKLNEDDGQSAAEAIRTTDTFAKEIAVEIMLDGIPVRIAGMAKGSGMIHPNMATMIAVLTTNVNIGKTLLQETFLETVTNSFNMVSVDGDTSTNDSAFILSNRQSRHQEILSKADKNYTVFKNALDYVAQALAKMIAIDGEGATKLIEVRVQQAQNEQEARMIAKQVVTSSLVKTAIFGEDGNWGRILCAVGNADVQFNPEVVQVWIENEVASIQIVAEGRGIDFDEKALDELLKAKTIIIKINLANGESSATAWGCDLSYDYIKINADYRT